jgi:hypothetical protein
MQRILQQELPQQEVSSFSPPKLTLLVYEVSNQGNPSSDGEDSITLDLSEL